jgi:hypothetical protein
MEEDVYRGRSEFDMIDGECARIRKEYNALRSQSKLGMGVYI